MTAFYFAFPHHNFVNNNRGKDLLVQDSSGLCPWSWTNATVPRVPMKLYIPWWAVSRLVTGPNLKSVAWLVLEQMPSRPEEIRSRSKLQSFDENGGLKARTNMRYCVFAILHVCPGPQSTVFMKTCAILTYFRFQNRPLCSSWLNTQTVACRPTFAVTQE